MNPEFDIASSPIPPGLSVIEASAGTGKTFAISHLVARFLADGTADRIGEILLVTFTNDAARELSERVRRVLEHLAAAPPPDESSKNPGVAALRARFGAEKTRAIARRALLEIDLLEVSTIHSFCQKTLQREGCGLPAVPELLPDASALADDAVRDLWEERSRQDPLFASISSARAWNWEDDAKFVRSSLSVGEYVAVPKSPPLGEILGGLREIASALSPDAIGELERFSAEVPKWNGASADGETRAGFLAAATGFGDLPAWLSACAWIASLALAKGGPIAATSKAGKAAIARAGELPAVAAAARVGAILDSARWAWKNECARAAGSAVAAALRENRQTTYDGLITQVRDALRGRSGSDLAARLRERFKIALIDEAQDTDPQQFEIFRSIFVGLPRETPKKNHRLVFIGDPKQSIYGFRGADLETYIAAKKGARGATYSLRKTFRAPAALVRGTNGLFSSPLPFLRPDLPFEPATSGLAGDRRLAIAGVAEPARIEFWIAPDESAEEFSNAQKRLGRISGAVAAEIAGILGAGATISSAGAPPVPVGPGHFAVLVRDRYQADAIADALRERGIPGVRSGGRDIMETEEAEELLRILRALEQPRRKHLRRAAMATRLVGLDAAAILDAEEDENPAWLERFAFWQNLWQREGIASAIASLDRECKASERLAPQPDGERRVTNLRQLAELLETASLEPGMHPARLVKWLADGIASSFSGEPPEERQTRLESDAEAVQIVTMHKAKGLEYDLVFCPFLWAGHNPKSGETRKLPGDPPRLADLDLAGEDAREMAGRADAEENLRLAYVAITRAKTKAWICAGAFDPKSPASALDWLLRPEPSAEYGPEWRESARAPGRGSRHADAANRLARESTGAISVLPFPETAAEDRWDRQSMAPGLEPPLPAPETPSPWGLTSFSGLTREKNPHAPPEEARPDSPHAADPANPFLSAPGGQLVGTALHEWIEKWDFASPPDAGAHLAKYRIPDAPPDLAARVSAMLGELRAAMLPGLGCPVAEACPEPAASEWHFQLPIAGALGPAPLAEIFRKHGFARYAALLGALPSDRLRGYLHGFIDRIAFRDGAWGVIDWKTNQLGLSPADYSPDRLLACAERDHYFLQAHLYLVALRRYLGRSAAIAGAWLIFLRGVRAGTPSGVLHIDPPRALLDDLDALFAHPQA